MNQKTLEECWTVYRKFGTISISYIQRKYNFSFKVAEKIVQQILQEDGTNAEEHSANIRKIFGKTRINKRCFAGAAGN